MATKQKSSNLPRKIPASSSFANSPTGILRRSTTNSESPTLNYANEALDAKLRRHNYNLQASAYANMNTSGEADYRPNNQRSTYPSYPNRGNAEEDEDSYDEEELQTEREGNDAILGNPNGITEERDQHHTDDKVEYVKRPQMKSELSDKEKVNSVTAATLPKGTARLSHANLPNYDPRIEYNTGWKGTESVPTYGSHLDMNETYNNYYNLYTQAQLKKLGYRYQDVNTNKMPPSASYYSWDKHLPEGLTKHPDSVKRAPISRSPSRKEPIKPQKQKECVGAEDSTTLETINYILGQMEFTEMSKIKRDLKDFQKARRRLIYDATSIKPIIPITDVEKKMLEKE